MAAASDNAAENGPVAHGYRVESGQLKNIGGHRWDDDYPRYIRNLLR